MKFILHELTLIIPTKDDHLRIENNIWDILSYLESKIQQYEVLIVSNNSSKESIEYLADINKYLKNVKGSQVGGKTRKSKKPRKQVRKSRKSRKQVRKSRKVVRKSRKSRKQVRRNRK